jgi:hypothetical protein
MRRALFPALLALAGCVRIPDVYAPPIQRRDPWEIQAGLKHFVHLNEPTAPDYILRDVLPDPENSPWRWTLKRPAFRFRVPSTQGKRFRAEMTAPDVTFNDTGPVSVTVTIAGHPLGRIEFKKPGDLIYEEKVPPEWLTTEAPVVVEMEVDKIWVSPQDGAQRGVIVRRLGFVE